MEARNVVVVVVVVLERAQLDTIPGRSGPDGFIVTEYDRDESECRQQLQQRCTVQYQVTKPQSAENTEFFLGFVCFGRLLGWWLVAPLSL